MIFAIVGLGAVLTVLLGIVVCFKILLFLESNDALCSLFTVWFGFVPLTGVAFGLFVCLFDVVEQACREQHASQCHSVECRMDLELWRGTKIEKIISIWVGGRVSF